MAGYNAALARTALIGVASAMISGCGATTSSVSDNLSLATLQKSNAGVAILMVGIAGRSCPAAHATLAQKVEGGYKAVEVVRIRNNLVGKGDTPQVELAPGSYHVVHWDCANGRYRRSVGKTNNALFGIGQKFLTSFASFTINAGEVVNLGYLRMSEVGPLGLVRFDVLDLPPQAHASLKKERPKLYAQMTTRLMKVEKKPLSEEKRKAYCDLVRALSKITKTPGQVPQDCMQTAGAL